MCTAQQKVIKTFENLIQAAGGAAPCSNISRGLLEGFYLRANTGVLGKLPFGGPARSVTHCA